jgi:hypothetical protein
MREDQVNLLQQVMCCSVLLCVACVCAAVSCMLPPPPGLPLSLSGSVVQCSVSVVQCVACDCMLCGVQVMFLQHGIMDSSYSFVAKGASDGLVPPHLFSLSLSLSLNLNLNLNLSSNLFSQFLLVKWCLEGTECAWTGKVALR